MNSNKVLLVESTFNLTFNMFINHVFKIFFPTKPYTNENCLPNVKELKIYRETLICGSLHHNR
jgi:hypothetical protein